MNLLDSEETIETGKQIRFSFFVSPPRDLFALCTQFENESDYDYARRKCALKGMFSFVASIIDFTDAGDDFDKSHRKDIESRIYDPQAIGSKEEVITELLEAVQAVVRKRIVDAHLYA